MWKKHVAGGAESLVSKVADGEALESADDKEIYYASARGDIWKLPADGGSISIVPGLANVHANRYCFVTPVGIYFLASELPPSSIRFYRFATRRISPVLSIK